MERNCSPTSLNSVCCLHMKYKECSLHLAAKCPKTPFQAVPCCTQGGRDTGISQWEKAGQCSHIAEGHTSKQGWLREDTQIPRSASWARTPEQHLPPEPPAARQKIGRGWDHGVSAFTQSAKGFLSPKSERCHKHPYRLHLTIKNNSESSLWTRVKRRGLKGSCKTLHWLLRTPKYHSIDGLDAIYPHINFHVINACLFPRGTPYVWHNFIQILPPFPISDSENLFPHE